MQDPCLLPCNHVYCEHCILTWLKMDDKTCPICEYDVDQFSTGSRFASYFHMI